MSLNLQTGVTMALSVVLIRRPTVAHGHAPNKASRHAYRR